MTNFDSFAKPVIHFGNAHEQTSPTAIVEPAPEAVS